MNLVAAIKKERAAAAIIALKVGGVEDSAGTKHAAEMALRGSPSIMFDAVAILAGPAGDKALSANPDAVGFPMDACRHLKAIGLAGVPELAGKAHAVGPVGITEIGAAKGIAAFIGLAREGEVWARESA